MQNVTYSSFADAHHFTIKKNIQIAAENYIHYDGPQINHGLNALVENTAINAVNDSAERCDAPKCMPETRVAVQEEILSWISYGDRDTKPKKMLWVTGPAGTGKTAILGSIADVCQARGLLAASFFFSSFSASLDRRSKKRLIATLAYQLVQHPGLEGVGHHITSSIERNPTIFKKQLKEQLEVLILNPLRDFAAHDGGAMSVVRPQVIVIDGLDECDAEQYNDPTRQVTRRSKEDDQTEILTVLTQAANDPSFPFRIVIASRPERHIREFFSSLGKEDVLELFLDEKYHPDADIALFYRSKFGDIRRRFRLPDTWPGEKAIEKLVEYASGQFIYAATVMRFIGGPSSPPDRQLEAVLRSRPAGDGTNPFSALDALYRCIMDNCPNPKLSAKWLRALPCQTEYHQGKNSFVRYYAATDGSRALSVRFEPPSAAFVNQFFESTLGEAEYALGSLCSLLNTPSEMLVKRGKAYSFYHRSFLDFLGDPARSKDIHVPMTDVNDFMRERAFEILKGKGPQVPMSSDERNTFLHEFTRIDVPALLSCKDKAQFKDLQKEYLKGDPQWWVETLLNTSEEGYYPYGVNQFLIHRTFSIIHGWCSSYKCLPACKHWRSALLKVCKSRGWTVPGTLELLQNKWDLKGAYTPFANEKCERMKPTVLTPENHVAVLEAERLAAQKQAN